MSDAKERSQHRTEGLVSVHFISSHHMKSARKYILLLRRCSNEGNLQLGKTIHAKTFRRGLISHVVLANSLLLLYAKCSCPHDARQTFDEIPNKTVVSWTALIAMFAQQRQQHQHHEESCHESLQLFSRMCRSGAKPNQFTLATVLPVCSDLRNLVHGSTIHALALKLGFARNPFVGSALVDFYAKCRVLQDARRVFNEMPAKNVVCWTAIVVALARCGFLDEALQMFCEMPRRNAVSWSAMISACVQNRRMETALRIFQEMPAEARQVFSWNAIISGCVQNGRLAEALEIFRKMQASDSRANSVTLTSVLPACAKLARLFNGREVHGNVIRGGFQGNLFPGNALVDMYGKCGVVSDARKVFNEMGERDVFSWSSMISGYAMHGCVSEALDLFSEMQRCGPMPDYVTLVGVLSAYCHAGLVGEARVLFEGMRRSYGVEPGLEHYTCMVDVLGRAGFLDEAWRMIHMMPARPDVVIWGSLLSASRLHRNVEYGRIAAWRLIELDPANPAHYVHLSNYYANVGLSNGLLHKTSRAVQCQRKEDLQLN